MNAAGRSVLPLLDFSEESKNMTLFLSRLALICVSDDLVVALVVVVFISLSYEILAKLLRDRNGCPGQQHKCRKACACSVESGTSRLGCREERSGDPPPVHTSCSRASLGFSFLSLSPFSGAFLISTAILYPLLSDVQIHRNK